MKVSEYSRPALRTAIYFFIFGFFWILLSDRFVYQIATNDQMEKDLQTYKGWFFILTTTILIFVVVKQQIKLVIDLKNKLAKSEDRYRKIVKMTHDLIWSVDKHGKILFINDACEDIYGYTPREMTGNLLSDFVPSNQYQQNLRAFEENLKQGNTYMEFETEIFHRNGEKIYLKDAVHALLDSDGNLIQLDGASTNITGYKDYQKKLIENQQRLELAMYGGEIGLWEYWQKTEKLIITKRWEDILGIELDKYEIDLNFLSRLLHPDDRPMLEKAFLETNGERDGIIESEFRIKHADGTYRWVNSKGKVTEWGNGNPRRTMGAIIDITEKKNLELELKNLVKVYSSFISYSNEGIYLFEMNNPMPTGLPVEQQIEELYHNGYIRTCNDAFARMYGFKTGEEMVGTDQETLHGSDSDPVNIELIRRFINSGYRIMNDVTRETDKDGNPLYISNNVVGIIENGKLLRTWGSQQNITDQVLSQQRLEESENRYRLLFETNPVPLVIFNLESLIFHDVNIAMEKLCGYPKAELLEMKMDGLMTNTGGLTGAELKTIIKQDLSVNRETILKSKPGNKIPCEIKLDRINFHEHEAVLGAINDLTGIRDAEKMVIQSLIEGADNERSRVAKEMHDGLGQHLTAASLNLNAVMDEAVNLSDKCLDKFRNGIQFLKTAIEESRNIAHNLMPKAIVDYGVVLSLNSLFNQIEKTTGISINFYENMGENVRLDMQTELNLYRITQEAINNVIKHAEATEVFVQLMLHPNEIIFTFEDNGKGFDKLIVDSGKKGIGVKSMYNRARAMSGYCDIDSSPGQGTTITVVIPVLK